MEQPLLLNVDWLGLSVRWRVKGWRSLSDRYSFIDYDGTNVWRKRRIIYNEYVEKVATIMWEPIASIIDQRAGLIEIANEWLYHGRSPDKILSDIQAARPFDVIGMSRCDLAVDYNPTPEQREIAAGLATRKYYVAGKRNDSQFTSVNHNERLASVNLGRALCHCQSWGHKTTSVKWKHYYKTKELLDAGGGKVFDKPYIIDCWREAGLEINDVWRLEVSMKHCNQLHFRGEPLSYPAMCSAPRELFMALYTERFSIHLNEGHADKSNDKVVEFLPIGSASGVRVAPPAATTQRNGRITLLRHLVASLDTEEVLLDDDSREEVLQHISGIVARDGLAEYFRVIVGTDLWSWVEAVRVRAYAILENHTAPNRITIADIMEKVRNFA